MKIGQKSNGGDNESYREDRSEDQSENTPHQEIMEGMKELMRKVRMTKLLMAYGMEFDRNRRKLLRER